MSIFLSYRRASQRTFALNLRELLQKEIQKLGMPSWEDVFLDERSIDPGQNFDERLQHEIASCDLFVAIVDSKYLGERFDQENDFVRKELLTACRAHRTIVPVVLDYLEWPPKRSLPDWAAHFHTFQAITDTERQLIAQRLADQYRKVRPLDKSGLHDELVSLTIVQLTSITGDLEPVVVSVGSEGTLCWTKLTDGKDYLPRLPLNLGRRVTASTVAGHGADVRVVLGLSDSSIAVCDLHDGVMIDAPRLEMAWPYDPNVGPLSTNGAYCTQIIYAPHRAENRLVYANTAGQINLWPGATSGLPVRALAPVRHRDRDALIVSRREFLDPTGIGDFIGIRDLDTGNFLAGEVRAWASSIITARTKNDWRIVSANREGVLQAWNTDLQLLCAADSHERGIGALTELGGILITGNTDGTVQPWAMENLAPLGAPRQEHVKEVTAIAAATIRNRRVVVSGGADGSIRSYMLESLLHTSSYGPEM